MHRAEAAGAPPPTAAPWWAQLAAPQEHDLKCLRSQPDGCSEIKDPGVCQWSRDGRKDSPYPGLEIYGSPCVWCGEGYCTGNSSNLCEPFEYLKKGEGEYFPAFLQPGNFKVSSCAGRIQLPDLDYSCLLWSADGCSWITDADLCLRSRDGRESERYLSEGMYGDPCVWCGGGVCTDADDAKCQPFDYLLNGRGSIYTTWHVQSASSFASCTQDGQVRALHIGPPPDYQATFDNEAPAEVVSPLSGSGVVPSGGVRDSEVHLQCGGKDWHQTAQCPDGMSCLVGNESDKYFCAGPGPTAPPEVPPGGRFVTAGGQVWWQSPMDGSRHLVTPGVGCAECGCERQQVLVTQGTLDAMPEGDAFDCKMKKADEQSQSARAEGRFITAGKQVWWQRSPEVGEKHLVRPGIGCERCGCGGSKVLIPESVADAIPDGEEFDCGMTTPEAAPTAATVGQEGQPGASVMPVLERDSTHGQGGERVPGAGEAGSEISMRRQHEPGVSVGEHFPTLVLGLMMTLFFIGMGAGLGFYNSSHSRATCPDDGSPPNDSEKRRRARAPKAFADADEEGQGSPGSVREEDTAPMDDTSLFDAIDRDHDGQITRDEWRRYAFDAFDRNRDGCISSEEWAHRAPHR